MKTTMRSKMPPAYPNNLCKIRAITVFLSLDKNRKTWEEEILKASNFCSGLAQEIRESGYIVQSVRMVTNPFGEYLNIESLDGARKDLSFLGGLLNSSGMSGIRIRFAAGEARTENEISLVPNLIAEFGDLCNVCVNVNLDDFGILNNELIQRSAEAVVKISKTTPRGEGNFNFTVNFNCPPLIPYFPASYHKKELGNRFVVGLETPDLLAGALKNFNQTTGAKKHNDLFKGYYGVMGAALQHHVSAIKNIIDRSNINKSFVFSGFDSSAAPSKNCAGITEIFEQMGVPYFGASGTVEAASLLTRVFQSIKGAELAGFSGLMLAPTEDTGLAQGAINSHFDIRALLTYSAVCGIGLDTVPIPGDTPADKISALMRDTGTMAYRLNKPLTVRLFPVPGLGAGDMTAFESDDLCNCAVFAVP